MFCSIFQATDMTSKAAILCQEEWRVCCIWRYNEVCLSKKMSRLPPYNPCNGCLKRPLRLEVWILGLAPVWSFTRIYPWKNDQSMSRKPRVFTEASSEEYRQSNQAGWKVHHESTPPKGGISKSPVLSLGHHLPNLHVWWCMVIWWSHPKDTFRILGWKPIAFFYFYVPSFVFFG